MPACRSRQRRKLGSPAHSLSLVTVKELVASNSSQLLFDLMKAEVSMVSWAQQLLVGCQLCQSPYALSAAFLALTCCCCGHTGDTASW